MLTRIDGLGNAEVGDLDAVAGLEHHVGRFDVAVHDVVRVGIVQGVGDLGSDGRRPLHRQATGSDDLLKSRAVDELHGQVAQALEVTDVVDRDDVGVFELGRDLRLTFEARQQLVKPGTGGGQAVEADGLDRHHAAEESILGLVDGAEGASA